MLHPGNIFFSPILPPNALTTAIGKAPDYDSAKTREIARLRAALPH